MRNVNFDDWDDFVGITLFGETHKIRLGTFNDSIKVNAMQKELDNLEDNEVAFVMIDFLVERFNDSGAKYTKDQFMGLNPAKVTAIARAITQGDDAKNPLDDKEA